MVAVINSPATEKEKKEMLSEFESYIKVVVDIKEEKLAGGGKLHTDCERALLDSGSKQENLWGGGLDLATGEIDYNSLTNIRPQDENPSQEILTPEKREKFASIIQKFLL